MFAPQHDNSYKDTFISAMRDATGMPAIVLLASMTGFGSLARDSGMTLGVALTSTAGIWGLPGQLAFAELYAAGAGTFAVVLAVSVANARFFPMALVLLPLLRPGLKQPRWTFLLVQMMSINSWVGALKACPNLAPQHRPYYFMGFATLCMSAGLIGTAIGYFAVDSLPVPVALALIFMNPVFFALLLATNNGRLAVLSLTLGALLGPALHPFFPEWGVVITGLVAGSTAFALCHIYPEHTPDGRVS